MASLQFIQPAGTTRATPVQPTRRATTTGLRFVRSAYPTAHIAVTRRISSVSISNADANLSSVIIND
ncbi:hypothetical protein CcaCcLH18_02606 [Colletotrichum camelliae]|nr:hypothetical protein CcaCcLH18_02606 [Colletotrichum camelliae]